MKMMHGACFLAFSNMSRTRAAPTPTNISTKSEPEIEKNGTLASPAMALASRVLPVPGIADHQHPLGNAATELLELGRIAQEIDQLLNLFLGLVATGNIGKGDGVLRLVESCGRVDLPNEKAPPLPPPCIWRMKKTHTPISSSIGNQLTKRFIRKDGSSSGLASILTPFFSRSETSHRSGGA